MQQIGIVSLYQADESPRDWNMNTIFKVVNKSKEEMITTINKTLDETIKLILQFDTT